MHRKFVNFKIFQLNLLRSHYQSIKAFLKDARKNSLYRIYNQHMQIKYYYFNIIHLYINIYMQNNYIVSGKDCIFIQEIPKESDYVGNQDEN